MFCIRCGTIFSMVYVGIISTFLLAMYGVLYSLLGYNMNFQNWIIETMTARAQTANMKDESELKGKRIYVPRTNRDVRVNVYQPVSEGILPAVFFAHPSNFYDGDADMYDDFCDWFAREFRCVLFSVNYTKIDVHVATYPQDEIRESVRYFISHADEYGFDGKTFVIFGMEAGAYLSLIAAVALVQDCVFADGYLFVNPWIDYVAVSFSTGGLHPGPVALVTTGEEKRKGRWQEYIDAMMNAAVPLKTFSDSSVPWDLLTRSDLCAADQERKNQLVHWLHERMDEFFGR